MRPWLAIASMIFSVATAAHELNEARVYVDAKPDAGLRIEYDVALSDLELAFGLDGDGDASLTVAEFDAAEPALINAWRTALTLTVDARRCALHAEPVQLRDYGGTRYASLALLTDCAAPAQSLELRSDFLFDGDSGHRVIVLFNGATGNTVQVATTSSRTLRFPTDAAASGWLVFFKQGVHHILIGYDHLAFLCCLLIGVVAPGRVLKTSQPLVTAVWVATAFTLAHSLTLSLAVFGVVTPASRPVEIAIAASVLIAAIHNLWPLVRLSAAWFAFGFGLIHGFGFAGALGELGLPRGSELLALLGFNLGVESGQLLVVAVAFPLFAALARRPRVGPVFVAVASIGIALLGAYWLVQRLMG